MDEYVKKKKGFSLGETDKERRNNLIIILLSALLIGVIAVFFVQRSDNQKMMQSMNLEKESIQSEYLDDQLRFDPYEQCRPSD